MKTALAYCFLTAVAIVLVTIGAALGHRLLVGIVLTVSRLLGGAS